MKIGRLSVLLQYLVPQHALSHLAGWLSNCRWHWIKNWEIRYFINRYQVDVNEAVLTSMDDYPTFNNFFTRLLKPELRPIDQDKNSIVCPADGGISQIGELKNSLLLQAKGFDYPLQTLVGGSETLTKEFAGGSFATIYLAPKDYHRVHMPLRGTLRETIFIPGDLFSVNQNTVNHVPLLFARNERLVCIFDTALGPMAVILVGAMLVGSINTVWGGTSFSRQIRVENFSGERAIILDRGAEMGHFKMGSTVIILFPPDKIRWLPDFVENSTVRMGTSLAKICQP